MKNSNVPTHGRIQGKQSIQILFGALCLMMSGGVFYYTYHTNNVTQLIKYDMPVVRKVLGLGSLYNRTLNNNILPLAVDKEMTDKHIAVTAQLTKAKATLKATRLDECNNCFHHNYNYVIDNPDICKHHNKSVPIELLVSIFTTHARRLQRDTIRKTWISMARKNYSPYIRYAFLLGEIGDKALGKAVIEENNINHDIIKEDFVDTYQNLTYKTIMAYKWANSKRKHAQFVMKTYDDMYVNIPALLNIIKTHKYALQTAVGGACHRQASPIRDRRSKWYASIQSYPNSTYPGFCSGTGYVTSMNVATKVFEISSHVPFFHLEDVYVALCIKKLKYFLKTIEGFNSVRVKPDPCIYKNKTMVTSHELPPALIEQIWSGDCIHKTSIPTL